MKAVELISAIALFAIVFTSNPSDGISQQVNGVLGSPDATTTIDGKQLPPPDPPFGGAIKERASESTPWWAPRVVPPKGAPNVLLIMTDDVGFSAPGRRDHPSVAPYGDTPLPFPSGPRAFPWSRSSRKAVIHPIDRTQPGALERRVLADSGLAALERFPVKVDDPLSAARGTTHTSDVGGSKSR
jgi:hypothetical protein